MGSVMSNFPVFMEHRQVAAFGNGVLTKLVPLIGRAFTGSNTENYKSSVADLARRMVAANRTSLFTRAMQAVKDAIQEPLVDFYIMERESATAEEVAPSTPLAKTAKAIESNDARRKSLERRLEEEEQAPVLVRAGQLKVECEKMCMLLGMLVFPTIKLCQEIRAERALLDVDKIDKGTVRTLRFGISAVGAMLGRCGASPPRISEGTNERLEFCAKFGACIPLEVKSLSDFVKFLASLRDVALQWKVKDASAEAIRMVTQADFEELHQMLLNEAQRKHVAPYHEIFGALYKDLTVRTNELDELQRSAMYQQSRNRLASYKRELKETTDALAEATKSRNERIQDERARSKTFTRLVRVCSSVCREELGEEVVLVCD